MLFLSLGNTPTHSYRATPNIYPCRTTSKDANITHHPDGEDCKGSRGINYRFPTKSPNRLASRCLTSLAQQNQRQAK